MTSLPASTDRYPCIVPPCMDKSRRAQDLILLTFLACQIVSAFLADPKDPPHDKFTEFHDFVVGFIASFRYIIIAILGDDHCDCDNGTYAANWKGYLVSHGDNKTHVFIRCVLSMCPGHHTLYVPCTPLSDIRERIDANLVWLGHQEQLILAGDCSSAVTKGYIAGLQMTFKGLRYDVPPLPAICDHPDLLTNSAPIDFYDDGSTFFYPGNELYIGREGTDSPTIYLPDGRNITCHVVASTAQCGTDSEMKPRRINVYRVVFEMNKTIIAAMVVFANFGYVRCHRVKFWCSGTHVPFASNKTCASGENSPFSANFGTCMEILESIALQLHTDPGSRLNADEGKLSMLNSAGEEIWAITATIDTTCYCDNGCFVYHMFKMQYMEWLCVACDEVVGNVIAPRYMRTFRGIELDTNIPRYPGMMQALRDMLLLSHEYNILHQNRTEEWDKLRWSSLRAAWVSSVIRTAGARDRVVVM